MYISRKKNKNKKICRETRKELIFYYVLIPFFSISTACLRYNLHFFHSHFTFCIFVRLMTLIPHLLTLYISFELLLIFHLVEFVLLFIFIMKFNVYEKRTERKKEIQKKIFFLSFPFFIL